MTRFGVGIADTRNNRIIPCQTLAVGLSESFRLAYGGSYSITRTAHAHGFVTKHRSIEEVLVGGQQLTRSTIRYCYSAAQLEGNDGRKRGAAATAAKGNVTVAHLFCTDYPKLTSNYNMAQ